MLYNGSFDKKQKSQIPPLIRDNSFLILACVMDLINFHSNANKTKKCNIVFHDTNIDPIDVDLLWVSLWWGKMVVCNKNDINSKITWNTLQWIEGKIEILYNQNGTDWTAEIHAIKSITLLKLETISSLLISDLKTREQQSSQSSSELIQKPELAMIE